MTEKEPIAITCVGCSTLFIVDWYPNALYIHFCPSCGAMNQQLPSKARKGPWHPEVEPLLRDDQ